MFKGIQIVAMVLNTLFTFFFLASCHGGSIPDFRTFVVAGLINFLAAAAAWKQGEERKGEEAQLMMEADFRLAYMQEDAEWWDAIEADIASFYFQEDCAIRAAQMRDRDRLKVEHAKLMEVLYSRLPVIRHNKTEAAKYKAMKEFGIKVQLEKPMGWLPTALRA